MAKRRTLEPQKINFRESFASLKFIPRFFREISAVNPSLFYTNLIGRVISAFLPLGMLYVGKLIVDEVVLQIALETKDLDHMWILIATEFALAIGSDLLRRGISYTDALLGDQYSIKSSVTIIRKNGGNQAFSIRRL